MDYKKIGQFIATERKSKNLTQAKLAQKLFVSEKTISKWENGKGLPETSILPKLCETLELSINELLNGERILDENYKSTAEHNLIELAKQSEAKNKKLYANTWGLTIISLIFYFAIVIISGLTIKNELLLIPVLVGIILLTFGLCFSFKMELDLSYYECRNCKNKINPTYKQALFAPHSPNSRYLKCPNCGKKTWAKRTLSK